MKMKRTAAVAGAAALAAVLLTGCSAAATPRSTGHVSELKKRFPEQIDLARARVAAA